MLCGTATAAAGGGGDVAIGGSAAAGSTLAGRRQRWHSSGQALVPTIVAKREGILDQDAYDAPRGRDVLGDDATAADEPTLVGASA